MAKCPVCVGFVEIERMKFIYQEGKNIRTGAKMIFTKEHSKLENTYFTTIRKNTGYYQVGNTYTVITPSEKFKVRVQSIVPLKKSDITDGIALADADMIADELRLMLESWYGKQYDDFILLRLVRRNLGKVD